MTLKRRISVVVPTFNRPAMLREALASIRELERSDVGAAFEIVVGDNGLKDENRLICQDFGGIYVPAHGRGASYARNAAMAAASGDYIAFLDDDDVWLPGHIGPQLAHLDAHPEHNAAFGQAIYTDSDLNPTGDPWPENPGGGDDLTRSMLSGLFPQIGTVVARRSVIDQIGYFDTRLIGGQDLDWLLRLATKNRLGFVKTPCILFRGRPPGTSDALQRMRIGFDRQVFLRHGLPIALRLWNSPLGMIRAYHKTLFHFYQYFKAQAIRRAENGTPAEVVQALATPALYLPLLLFPEIIGNTGLRAALLAAARRWLGGKRG
jgi:glycosyltransferase involved in cell wall biosynthesis